MQGGNFLGIKRELAIIKMLQKLLPAPSDNVSVGMGDDAAVLQTPSGNEIFTTDALVEDVHFKESTHPPLLLGIKAVTVSVSDIRAMGGIPSFALLTLALPGQVDDNFIKKLGQGIAWGCRQYRLEVIGGDTTGSPGPIFINLMAWGWGTEIITRSGAAVGDWIWVSGTLGDARAGLQWTGQAEPRELKAVERFFGGEKLEQFLAPEPAYLALKQMAPLIDSELGALLAGAVNAMLDISDGLSDDLAHICRQSRVGARIDREKIPISPELKWWAKQCGENPQEIGLIGGEDYELLFCAAPEKELEIRRILDRRGVQGKIIGEIKPQNYGLKIARGTEIEELKPGGWDHFAR